MPIPAIATVIGIVVLYIGSYLLNKNTDAPIKTFQEVNSENCGACTNYACGIKQQFSEER